MKLGKLGLLAAAALVLSGMVQTPAHAIANLIVNPGFEDPITFDGPPFVGSWEGFSGGAGSAAANANVMPHGGLQHLLLAITNTDNTFAGAFQDVSGLLPGDTYTFGGWHMTPSSPLDLGVEVRIEWRNSVSNSEISRTPNLTPIPGGAYSQFSITATVPPGANSARVVYAIQTFGGEPSNNGTVYVDDASFGGQPTPAKGSTWGRLKGLYR